MAYGGTPCLSSSHLRLAVELIRARRRLLGSTWRRLTPGRQAHLVLTHLRCNSTYAQLAETYQVGTATVFRYVREVVELLASLSPSLTGGVWAATGSAYAILDGVCVPIDRYRDAPRDPITGKRVGNDSHYCGKHKRFCVNFQGLTDPAGVLLWLSGGLPGSVHDLTAARVHGILTATAKHGVRLIADTAYIGAPDHVTTGVKRRDKDTPQWLSQDVLCDWARFRVDKSGTAGGKEPESSG